MNAICESAWLNGMSYGQYIAERSKIMSEEIKNEQTAEEAPKKHGGIREPLPPEKVERVREMLAEIKHLKAEVRACRELLRRKE